MDLRTLPIEGLELRQFVVEGNGKDAVVHAVAIDGRRFDVETRRSHLRFTLKGTVVSEVTRRARS